MLAVSLAVRPPTLFPVNLTKGDIYLLLLCALKLTGEMNMTEIKEWKITEEQNASQYEDGCGCVCGIAMDKASLRHREPGFLSLPHWEPLLKPVSPASDIFP